MSNNTYTMNPIFYRHKESGDCFRIMLNAGIAQDQIDAVLDVLSPETTEFITVNEFTSKYDKLMDIDIFDTTDTFKIGTLTTKWLDMDNVKEL